MFVVGGLYSHYWYNIKWEWSGVCSGPPAAVTAILKGEACLNIAIARLLHTVFVPAPQKSKSSLVTGLFTGASEKREMQHTIIQPQAPNSNPEMAPYLMVWSDVGFEYSRFCLSGAAFATIWRPLKALELLFQQGSGSHSRLSATRQRCLGK